MQDKRELIVKALSRGITNIERDSLEHLEDTIGCVLLDYFMDSGVEGHFSDAVRQAIKETFKDIDSVHELLTDTVIKSTQYTYGEVLTELEDIMKHSRMLHFGRNRSTIQVDDYKVRMIFINENLIELFIKPLRVD